MITDKQQVDCVITSPPYYSLRDYGIKPTIWDGDLECDHIWTDHLSLNILKDPIFCVYCGAWYGVLGSEPNFELYIKHLCDIYDLIWKVLKDTGTNWVNMGTTMKKKCDLMIPERFAIEMCERGWIKRRTNIWQKPNAMPSNVKDDFTLDFEYIYFFVKKRKYCFEQQFEESTTEFIYSRNSRKGSVQERNNPRKNWGFTQKELKQYDSKYLKDRKLKGSSLVKSSKKERDLSRIQAKKLFPNNIKKQKEYIKYIHDHAFTKHEIVTGRIGNYSYKDSLHKNAYSIIGKRNKRTVWSINTIGNPAAHFAIFPSTLVEIPILAGCPKYVCSKCGKPREKIIEKQYTPLNELPKDHRDYRPTAKRVEQTKYANITNGIMPSPKDMNLGKVRITNIKTKGFKQCSCNTKFIPGVVLDPFAGIGTTSKVAYSLGRNYISFEISKQYCDIFDKWYKNQSIRLDRFIFSELEVNP